MALTWLCRGALGLALAMSAGCSFVLDPDELHATLSDGGDLDANDADATDAEGDLDSDAASDTSDVPVGPAIVVRHSGANTCTFDFARSPTQCPITCPSAGWTYVVDASDSVGVGTFAWTFEVTGGYVLDKRSAAGPRVSLVISLPECLIGGGDVRPFTLIARLSVDGGDAQLVELPVISVASVTTCGVPSGCAAP
jgi:hypothetical protein